MEISKFSRACMKIAPPDVHILMYAALARCIFCTAAAKSERSLHVGLFVLLLTRFHFFL